MRHFLHIAVSVMQISSNGLKFAPPY